MSVQKNKSNGNKGSKEILKYLPGIAIGLILSFSGEVAIAGLYLNINDMALLLFSATYLIFAVASFLCGYITQKQTKEKGIKVGAVSGLCLGVIVSSVNCLIVSFEGVGVFILIISFLQTGMSSIGGIIAANRKKRY